MWQRYLLAERGEKCDVRGNRTITDETPCCDSSRMISVESCSRGLCLLGAIRTTRTQSWRFCGTGTFEIPSRCYRQPIGSCPKFRTGSNSYPFLWKIFIILPFVKTNSDPSLPVSYLLIALSSVFGKLFQEFSIKKTPLVPRIEQYPSSFFQYGFKKDCSTSQPLFGLQNEINESSLSKACLYSVFFDLQQACPWVWRRCISSKLFGIDLSRLRMEHLRICPHCLHENLAVNHVFTCP